MSVASASENELLSRESAPGPGIAVEPAAEDPAGKIHFPGLNGLRFVAAFSVLLYHVEAFKSFAEMPNWISLEFWRALGPYGVVCFFTLSGFLITYLLLEETKRSGTIRIRKFYLRRILRIWPLYYLIVALGFLALPGVSELLVHKQVQLPEDTFSTLPLFVFFLPNMAWVFYGIIPFLGPLWSVGVEEQFYLLWPALLRVLRRHPLAGILGVIAVMLGLRFVLPQVAVALASGPAISRNWQVALAFLWTLKLECMAMGALAAYVLHRDRTWILKVLHHPLTQIAALGLILASLGWGLRYRQFDNVVWGGAFAVLIVNLAGNPKSLLRLENRALDYLGRISFGLYVYHSFVIAGLLLVLRNWMPTDGFLFNSVLYALAAGLTVGLSGLSYRYYESPFLRLKTRYMVVQSSGTADR